ncbi:MAG: hypothetical protein K2O35_03060 [Clostridia bacterium]|nr:hypothetical protein [Clostridia bacterium]
MQKAQVESKKWWLWKIDAMQIEKIKAKDGKVIRRFWEDNENLIKNIVKKQVLFLRLRGNRKTIRLYELDDFINQVYVDLPLYDYENSRKLYYSIVRSVEKTAYGGYGCFVPFKALDIEDLELLEAVDVPYEDTYFQDMEYKEIAKITINIIANQKQLTDMQRDVLTSVAFGWLDIKGAYEYAQAYYNN